MSTEERAEISGGDKQVFEYNGKTIVVIPNQLSEKELKEFKRKD